MLSFNSKLGYTKYLRSTFSWAMVETRTLPFNTTKNTFCQFQKNVATRKTSYEVLNSSCQLRPIILSTLNSQKTVTPLNEVPDESSENEATLSGKIFKETEGNFHHAAMEDSSSYSSTIFKQDPHFITKYQIKDDEFCNLIKTEDWQNKSVHYLAATFASLGVYSKLISRVTLEDERLDKFFVAFLQKCPSFTDDQLIDCLIALQYWPSASHVKEEQFLKVWKTLDGICHERYIDWSIDKNLFVIDLWFQLKLARLSSFVFKALNKVSRKCGDLTKAQIVQTLFYMSCVRKIHPAISMRDYEYNLQKYITHMTIEEIGIFALAFFKIKLPIMNEKLIIYMMQRVIEEIDSIPQMTLTAIAKVIRLSHKPAIGFTANDFVNHIVQTKMDSLELINAIHILHITTQVQFFNPEAITKLAEKFYNNPSKARLKDIERVAFIMSLFNYIPPSTPDILDMIIEEIEKPHHQQDGETHHLIMVSLVYFLTLFKRYPENIIKNIINDDYLLKKSENKYLIPVQAMQIDFNRALEGPPGSEYLLSLKLREYLARRYCMFTTDRSHRKRNTFDQMMFEVMELTEEVLGGEQYSLVTRPLPQFSRADIVFHLDDAGNPVEIPEEFRSRVLFEDVIPAPDPKGWYCVVIGGRNMYMHNLPKLIGEQVTKHRQLQLLGYNTITLPYHYWKGEKNKLDYLKLKYFTRKD